MKKREWHNHFRLTLIFMLSMGIVMCISFILVGFIMYFLIKTNVLTGSEREEQARISVMLLGLIVNFFVAINLTALFIRIPLRPIKMLISKLNMLADGKYDTRIHKNSPLARNIAFSELADSFNKLASELEHTEVLREDFVNNFSHEFKTPIVSIAGFAKLLKKGNLSPQEQEEYLTVIEEESLRLASMATNVLNLTKIENQTILTDVTEYNLSEQIRSCVLLLENKWSKKNIEFSLEFDEYMVCANEEQLKQVWINLIDNAIKFSPIGENIEIEIEQSLEKICVSVTNKGEEISKEDKKRIFNKFYQADKSHSKEGNGVGLSIVRKIVELHKGAISVASKNNTTTFSIQLPVAQSEYK